MKSGILGLKMILPTGDQLDQIPRADLDSALDQRLTIPAERKLQDRYLPHQEKLLTLLYYP
jgi:hypothetical protein